MTIFTHKFRLKDVTEIQVGFPFKSAEYSDTGIKLLRGDNIGQGFLQWNGVKFWPIEKSSHLSQYILEPFWKFAMIGFQEVLSVIQRQDVDASTTRPHGRNYTQDETLSV